MSTSVSVRISEDLVRKLDEIAKETERSRAFHIQKALEAYFEELADYQIALDRLHDVTDPVISLDEMRDELEV
jgi:predicted transcriptional regulator